MVGAKWLLSGPRKNHMPKKKEVLIHYLLIIIYDYLLIITNGRNISENQGIRRAMSFL